MRRLWNFAGVLIMAGLCLSGCERAKPGPTDLLNGQAELTGTLPFPVWQWKALTTGVDRGAGTTYTLFGNDAAVSAARSGQSYPVSAVVAMVTWRQRDDPHWFGARIAGDPVSVEFVTVAADGTRYQRFAGSPLQADTSAAPAGRAEEILAEKAVVLP
jgi:hypothetical protein